MTSATDAVASLLPPNNRRPAKKALALSIAPLFDLPAHLISIVTDPLRCPPDLLPFCAWHYSVDLWDDQWPTDTKRSAIIRQIALARIKGTQAAIEGYVELAGSKVLEVKAPPQKSFLARRRTKDEIDAYLDKLPSIRVYIERKHGEERGGLYLGRGALSRHASQTDHSPALYGRKAVLNVRGVETPLSVYSVATRTEGRVAKTTERIALPGKVGSALVIGRGAIGQKAIGGVALEARSVTHVQNLAYDHQSSEFAVTPLVPGLDPVNPRYQRISDRGRADRRAFCGTALGHRALGRDRSPEMVYDRLRLFDPEITPPLPHGRSFLGSARLGMKPFTAEVMIKTEKPAQGRRIYLGFAALGRKAVGRDDLRLHNLAREAVAISKEHHSKVLVTFQTTRRITFGDAVPMDGTYRFNSRVRAHL